MRLFIRQAGPEELPAAARLLSIKYGRSYEPEQIAHVLGRFEPERNLAWIAFDGTQPVGVTMVLIRELDLDGQKIRAGYWAQLYIRPEYRSYLLYPRLTQAMIRALPKNDLAVLYTGVRRAEVARAHTKLGFIKLGELAVRAKPLRPVRLVLRYKAWNACTKLADVPDFLYRGVLRLRAAGNGGLQPCALSQPPDFDEFADLLNHTRSRVRQVWNVSRLTERYTANREGEPYSLLGVRRQGMLVAAAVWRAALRGNGVRAGVLMDLAFRKGEEPAARKLLGGIEWNALHKNCDVMLHLDGISEASGLTARGGYYCSPERYTVLLWPTNIAKKELLADLGTWRYGFADHDTF